MSLLLSVAYSKAIAIECAVGGNSNSTATVPRARQHPRHTLSPCPVLPIYYSEVGVVIPILQVKDLKLRERLGFLNNRTKLFLTLDFFLNKVYWNADKFVCFHSAYGYLCAPSEDLME